VWVGIHRVWGWLKTLMQSGAKKEITLGSNLPADQDCRVRHCDGHSKRDDRIHRPDICHDKIRETADCIMGLINEYQLIFGD
jgi:hypothetical protein